MPTIEMNRGDDESGSESWETESEHSVADEGKVAKTEDDKKKGMNKYQQSFFLKN